MYRNSFFYTSISFTMNRLPKFVRHVHNHVRTSKQIFGPPKSPYEQGYQEGYLHGMNVMLMVGFAGMLFTNVVNLK